MKLEELSRDARVAGILPDGPVTILDVRHHGEDAVQVVYRTEDGRSDTVTVSRTQILTSLNNRAQLAEILLDSLRGPEPGSLQDERLVLEEAVRRDEELASGSVEGRPWTDVLAAARARLR